VNWLRVFFVGGVTSYRALFNWITPWVFFPTLVAYPLFQIVFFAYLGRYADVQSDRFFLIGNTFVAIAITGFFGMGHSVANERRSQTLASVLATPASRLALFLGRATPSVITGVVVAAISFTLGALVLHVHISAHALTLIALAVVASSFACTAFGLCLGSLGLRGRNVSLFADAIGGSLLLVAGANVPVERLPGWLRTVGSALPVTHGIEAARRFAGGATLHATARPLVLEFLIGGVYLALGVAMLRYFEHDGRKHASFETF
jgi:ABC-2 type transport system permease protein